jgi:AbrB family looped-hinge helix DNA binding protein
LGRVSIPKGMRDRLGIKELDEVEFYLLEDDGGEQYVALTNHAASRNKYAEAADVLVGLGLDIPDELAALVNKQ